MQQKVHTIDEYRDIETDVWLIFKKYYDDDANMLEWNDDIEKLTQKYEKDVRQYCFFRALLKVHFEELNELKGIREVKWY